MSLSKWFDKPWWKVVKWLIVLAAYGYMAYQLAMYDNYAGLWEVIRCTMHNARCMILMLLALVLMPLNIFLEAVKWRFLNRDIEILSLKQAQREVYGGFIGAFLTPYRAGDFPTRAIYRTNKEDWSRATAMGFVGGVALTLVILLVGLVPAVFYFNQVPAWWQIGLAVLGCVAFCLLVPYGLNTKFTPIHTPVSILGGAMAWSLLRYFIFSIQLYCVLRGVGMEMGLKEAFVAIPFYYLLVTLTPNMPIADVGIRGSWAMVVFGQYGEVPIITVAVVVLYVINTLLPTLIGSVLMLTTRQRTITKQ